MEFTTPELSLLLESPLVKTITSPFSASLVASGHHHTVPTWVTQYLSILRFQIRYYLKQAAPYLYVVSSSSKCVLNCSIKCLNGLITTPIPHVFFSFWHQTTAHRLGPIIGINKSRKVTNSLSSLNRLGLEARHGAIWCLYTINLFRIWRVTRRG